MKLPASSVTAFKDCSGRSRLTSLSRAPTSEVGPLSVAPVVTLTEPFRRPVRVCAVALGSAADRLNIVRQSKQRDKVLVLAQQLKIWLSFLFTIGSSAEAAYSMV